MTIKLPASSLKPALNRALLFINQAKLGLSPLFGCFYLEGDKCSVYNGETGAVLNFPFSVSEPTLLFPFELAKLVNATRELAEVSLTFDYKAMQLIVVTPTIKTKIRLLNVATQDVSSLAGIKVPADLVPFEMEGLYERVKRATFSCSADASLPLLQGVRVTPQSICSTDQRGVWREQATSPQAFVIPRLMCEHIERALQEPSRVGVSSDQLYLFYSDMMCFGRRLAEDHKYPDVDGAFDKVVRAVADQAVVTFDREALTERLTALLSLPQYEGAVLMKCTAGELSVQNVLGVGVETESVISMPVQSTADFADVCINGQLLLEGVSRFSQLAVKADGRRIAFWNATQEYAVSRRAVQ